MDGGEPTHPLQKEVLTRIQKPFSFSFTQQKQVHGGLLAKQHVDSWREALSRTFREGGPTLTFPNGGRQAATTPLGTTNGE